MDLGTFLLVPLSQAFISMTGWRMTFIITGVLVLVILLPSNALLLRHKPREVCQYPDGMKPFEASAGTLEVQKNGNPASADWTLSKAA
jgi:predicted MFS family arabinose efflux permease